MAAIPSPNAVTRVAIQSVAFPGHYVGLDGWGVTSHNAPGGKVKPQSYIAAYEVLYFQQNTDGTVSFRSPVFDNIYIRMDGSGVPPGGLLGAGGGTVNAQFNAFAWEKFRIRKKQNVLGQYKGVVGIESVAFPGRFLRLDAIAGTVNVQGVFMAYEEFEILNVG